MRTFTVRPLEKISYGQGGVPKTSCERMEKLKFSLGSVRGQGRLGQLRFCTSLKKVMHIMKKANQAVAVQKPAWRNGNCCYQNIGKITTVFCWSLLL